MFVSIGSSATISTASMARRASTETSTVIRVDSCQRSHPHRAVDLARRWTDPRDRDVAETPDLIEFDEALFVQLEHCEEAHDDFEAIDERTGQTAERDATDPRQFVDEFVDRVGDARADRRNVIEL